MVVSLNSAHRLLLCEAAYRRSTGHAGLTSYLVHITRTCRASAEQFQGELGHRSWRNGCHVEDALFLGFWRQNSAGRRSLRPQIRRQLGACTHGPLSAEHRLCSRNRLLELFVSLCTSICTPSSKPRPNSIPTPRPTLTRPYQFNRCMHEPSRSPVACTVIFCMHRFPPTRH